MTLYEINDTIRQVLENGISYDLETGEILFDDTDLDQLRLDLEQKIENIGIFVKNLRAEAEAMKAEEAALKKRREHKERVADHYADYVKDYLTSQERPRFETTRVLIQIRRSEAVEIDSLAKIPMDYIVEKYDVKPDKMALKKALKRGETIEGVHLVENKNITIK